MPTRILRDWTDSEKINALSAEAERFFTRLIMKADDFGRYSADPRMLTANLFPLKIGEINCQTTEKWLAECRTAKLLETYATPDGKNVLQISNFQQRVRQEKSKWPDSRGQYAANGPSMDGQPRPEAETDTGDVVEGVGVIPNRSVESERPTLIQAKAYAGGAHCSFRPDRVEEWFAEQQANLWKYSADWRARMRADSCKEYWSKPASKNGSNGHRERWKIEKDIAGVRADMEKLLDAGSRYGTSERLATMKRLATKGDVSAQADFETFNRLDKRKKELEQEMARA